MLNMKWLTIPFGTRRIDAVDTWSVRWYGRKGVFHADTDPQVEVFADYDSAKAFADSLERSFALLKIRGEKTTVYLRKN